MTFSLVKIIKYQLYLLQLENYNISRFWRVFWRRGFFMKQPMRQTLAWTAKMKLIFSIALAIEIFILVNILLVASAHLHILASLVILAGCLYLLSFLFGLWSLSAAIIIYPMDYFLKQRLIAKAKDKIKNRKNLKVIGITGSYGKTTMKEFISEVAAQKYKVLKTEFNKNTPLGVAELILEKLAADTEILVVEMGAYKKGDVKKLCEIARPDISILTGINESHLERFGSMENTIATKFEIVKHSKKDAAIILNADDDLVLKYCHDYIGGRKALFFSAYNNKRCAYRVIDKQFVAESLYQKADIMHKDDSVGPVKTSFLGEYIFGDIIAAIITARELNIDTESIRHGIMRTKPIKHRLYPIKGVNNVLVIDDSYNGSINGVEEAICTLSHFKNRRKIYITPGLVETGAEAQNIHCRIGRRLSRTADLVILIKNSVTPYIEKGLIEGGFAKDKIMFFKSANEAHAQTQNLTKSGDVVLFQNDWPDNYI